MGCCVGRDGLIGSGVIADKRGVWECELEKLLLNEDAEGVDCDSQMPWILVCIQFNTSKALHHREHT